MTRPDYWLIKFSKLRIDRARAIPQIAQHLSADGGLADFVEHMAVRGVQLLKVGGESVNVQERELGLVERPHDVENVELVATVSALVTVGFSRPPPNFPPPDPPFPCRLRLFKLAVASPSREEPTVTTPVTVATPL